MLASTLTLRHCHHAINRAPLLARHISKMTTTISSSTTKRPSSDASPSLLYANKTFRSQSNTSNGEVSPSTTFHYNQDARNPHIVWAEYSGGSITRGFLIATVQEDQSLDARYQHVNEDGELRTGVCRSVPEVLGDGRVRLIERWRWTSGDGSSGESVVEEVRHGS